MKALAILGAIVAAWVSGASSAEKSPSATNGAVVLLLGALALGWIAWRLA